MCKVGDIIVINKYIGDDNKEINKHSFVVISDEKGTITSLDYDIVASVISSFKSEIHRLKKLKFKENLELPLDSMMNKNFKKKSYIKSDQLYYFNKDKLDYYILGTLKFKYLNKLLNLVYELDKENKLKENIKNL